MKSVVLGPFRHGFTRIHTAEAQPKHPASGGILPLPRSLPLQLRSRQALSAAEGVRAEGFLRSGRSAPLLGERRL